MLATIIISIVIGVVVAYVVISIILPIFQKNLIDQVISVANEKLGSDKQEIKTDMENKKDAIEKIAKDIREELNRTKDKLDKSDRERIGSFHALTQEIKNQQRITEQLNTNTENLKRVLSNNQLRGQFGEQVAENLLKMSGFVKGTDYEFNKQQEGSDSRPDFTIYLPDKVKINIDSKFPYQDLQKAIETEDRSAKKEHLKLFERAVREKIKQMTSRNYINPEDNTVDFVILFIPNEMIFSYIYDRLNDVWLDAMKQKVIMTGPFSFTAILRMVRQAYDNFHYQKNIQKIISYIKVFEEEFGKYNEEFVKIGDRIDSLSDQYTKVNTTRSNQLLKSVEKIKLNNEKQAKLIP